MATVYELDGPVIESRWGEIFRPRPGRPWGLPSLLYNGYRVIPGVKRPGRGVDHAEVKERVELYLYSSSGPSWPVLGRTLPLPDSRSDQWDSASSNCCALCITFLAVPKNILYGNHYILCVNKHFAIDISQVLCYFILQFSILHLRTSL